MGKLFIVSGPSGSGKSTLCRMLCEEDEKLKISVSATTRAPRFGEEEAKSYFFIGREEFLRKIENGEFYEHARVFENFYGTLRSHVEQLRQKGYDVILEINIDGALQAKARDESAVLIFIMPPDENALEERLRGRESETDEQLRLRLKTAKEEMNQTDLYDYVVVNDDVRRAVDEIHGIIESCRNKKE